MSLEKYFLPLRGKGHYKRLPRVAELHAKDLGIDQLARYAYLGFAPVTLGVGARGELYPRKAGSRF